jgi:outer membrane receptor protein involved in Fe transport
MQLLTACIWTQPWLTALAACNLFANIADFAAGRAESFRQAFGAIDTAYAVQNHGAFIQDHWSVARGLTFDFGLRYDFQHLPVMFRQDADNVSPRAGLE